MASFGCVTFSVADWSLVSSQLLRMTHRDPKHGGDPMAMKNKIEKCFATTYFVDDFSQPLTVSAFGPKQMHTLAIAIDLVTMPPNELELPTADEDIYWINAKW